MRLNRRVLNGTHGGVRGRGLFSPSYSILLLCGRCVDVNVVVAVGRDGAAAVGVDPDRVGHTAVRAVMVHDGRVAAFNVRHAEGTVALLTGHERVGVAVKYFVLHDLGIGLGILGGVVVDVGGGIFVRHAAVVGIKLAHRVAVSVIFVFDGEAQRTGIVDGVKTGDVAGVVVSVVIAKVFRKAVFFQHAVATAGDGAAVRSVGVGSGAEQHVALPGDDARLFTDESALEHREAVKLSRGIPVGAERGEGLVRLARAAGLNEGEGVLVAKGALRRRIVAAAPDAGLLEAGLGDLDPVGAVGEFTERTEHLDRLGITPVFEKSACFIVCLLLAASGEENAQSQYNDENAGFFHAAPSFLIT